MNDSIYTHKYTQTGFEYNNTTTISLPRLPRIYLAYTIVIKKSNTINDHDNTALATHYRVHMYLVHTHKHIHHHGDGYIDFTVAACCHHYTYMVINKSV